MGTFSGGSPMARDYARKAPKRPPSRLAASGIWLVAGLTIGACSSVAVYWHLQSPTATPSSPAVLAGPTPTHYTTGAPVTQAVPSVEQTPRFDFYTLLSNMQDPSAPSADPIEVAPSPQAPPVFPPLPSGGLAVYIVELERFHSKLEAQSVHAKLLAQGFNPGFQASEAGQEAYRLYLGPFASEQGADHTVEALKAQGFRGSLVVKYQAN